MDEARRVRRLPNHLDVDYAVYLRPLDAPSPRQCPEHDDDCGLVQHFAVMGRHGAEPERPLAVVEQEGHLLP